MPALDDVSFTVADGACHALLGENGAGKSTLGKILAGIDRPDSGQMLLDGQVVHFHEPRDAAPPASASCIRNWCSARTCRSPRTSACTICRGAAGDSTGELRRRAKALLAEIRLDLDVDPPVSSLSIAQEQMVQIAAAVGLGAKMLVFDEPTSSLGRHEVEQLFALIRRLQADGVTIIYVSHRLEEIFELCQAVTVLRDGRHVATQPIGEVDHDELVRLMVGRELRSISGRPASDAKRKVRRDCKSAASHRRANSRDVDLEVHAGEIVGLAGLVGAGRTEIAQAIFGLDPHASGTVTIDGQATAAHSPRQAMRRGIALVPEDRKRHGLVLSMNVRQNLTLPMVDRFRSWLTGIDRRAERRLADEYCQRLSVRAPGYRDIRQFALRRQPAKDRAGQSRGRRRRVLLIDEPTRGVDVGAKREIHDLIASLAKAGAAVLVISSDLPELLALADRVIVLRQGRRRRHAYTRASHGRDRLASNGIE